MAELPETMETVEDNGSVVPQPSQSDCADGARSEHGALARREYSILALDATKGGQANAGAAGGEDNHGALANQEGTEEEGDETPQCTLPVQEANVGNNEAILPPLPSLAYRALGAHTAV